MFFGKLKIDSLLPPIPKWLSEKLNEDKIVISTFGGGESIFALVAQALAYLDGVKEPVKEALISFTDVQRIIDTYLEQEDKTFDCAGLHRKTMTSALLLSIVMQHFNINKIDYKKSVGNTPGMLIAPQLRKGLSTAETCAVESEF